MAADKHSNINLKGKPSFRKVVGEGRNNVISRVNSQSLLYTNIQCLRNKIDILSTVLLSSNTDIVCLTETWLRNEEIESFPLDGYTVAASFCRKLKNNGGVIIYTKSSLCVKTIDVSMYTKEIDIECSAVEYTCNNVKTRLLCLYRSPSGNFVHFANTLSDILHILCKPNVNLIVVGDFNVDFHGQSNNKMFLLDLFASFGLHQTITEPTRVTATSSSCIDNIFTNLKNDVVAGSFDIGLSDHCCLIMKISDIKPISSTNDRFLFKRTYGLHARQRFKQCISKETWESVFSKTGVDLKFNNFMEIFYTYFNKAFPLKKCKVGKYKNTHKNNGWYTDDIKAMSKTVKQLYENHRVCRDPSSKIKYCDAKRRYSAAIRQAKRNLNDDIIGSSSNKSQAAWQIINGNKNSKRRVKSHLCIMGGDNELIVDPQQVADSFNEYFSNIVPNLLKNKPGSIRRVIDRKIISNVMFLFPTNEAEVIRIIRKISSKHSAGIDGIPCDVLRGIETILCVPLVDLINASLAEGCFPSALKIAKVIALLKGGDSELKENYRPIALLSVFSKIFELIMYTRIVSFLEKFSILNECQNGFRKNRSTDTAIFSFINKIIESLDKKQHVLGLFYDFTKAFECINHSILLQKIENMGLSGNVKNWIQSYLSDRQQIVSVSGSGGKLFESKIIPINTGVPQGSILGPLLFLLATNDLPSQVSHGSLTLFADDTNHLIISKDIQQLYILANAGVVQIENYCSNNDLFLNCKKTNAMQFRTQNKESVNTSIQIGDQHIIECNETKFLGLHINSNLTWTSHIQNVSSKISSGCFLIKRLRQITSQSTVLLVYYAHMYSHMQYGVVFWGFSSKASRIFVLQKRAIRYMINSDSRSHCRPHFIKLRILTFPCIYIFNTILFIKTNMPQIFTNNEVHNYDTRGKNDLRNCKHKLNLVSNGPLNAGIKFYNKLPHYIKHSQNFKSSLKSFLLDHGFYSVKEFLEF